MMKNIELKNPEIDVDGLIVQYSVSAPKDDQNENKRLQEFYEDYRSTLNELERLTNNADGLDYALAASSGVVAGIIDVFFVGELGLFKNASDEAKERFRSDKGEVNEKVNRYIEKYAKRKGCTGNSLEEAIVFLEKEYPVAQDNVWSGKKISSTYTHHLDDLAHHPTLLGLLSAIIVQYFRLAVFSNKQGKNVALFVKIDKKEFIKNLMPIVISGVLKWLVYMVEQKEKNILDDELPKPIHILVEKLYLAPAAVSVLKTVDNWYGHLVSDMGGSKNTPGGGTGIPGLFLSLMKEISMLPGVNNSNLPKLLNDLYQGTAASPLTDKLDLRTEITVVKEQQLPVIVNEILVRLSYFLCHLVAELQNNDLQNVNWKNVVPIYNRTTVRMMTISTFTMEVVDAADAAIRAAAKSGGFMPGFAAQFVVRINFVGLGRFALACTTDAAMGLKKTTLEYAVASAEIAIASDVTSDSIEELELSKQNTRKKLDVLNAQTSELSELKF